MSAFAIQLGGELPLSLTLGDGASGVFPQANVYDSSDVEVGGSPFDLTEVGATGRYTGASFTPFVAGTFVSRYVVYSDAGHTTELLRYERSEDSYVVDDIAARVWDEVLTGATHNINNSAGKRLRQLADRGIVAEGIAQGSGTATITLALADANPDDFYNDMLIAIVGGTGDGQIRLVLDYVAATKVALVHRDWEVAPDATSEYVIGLLGASAGRNPIRDAVFARVMETGFSFDRMVRIIAAAVAGETSGGPGSQAFRNLADLLDQFSMDANDDGNRSGSAYGA